jgi:4-diphosphocytidyl-2-C-methyl-D-erythritol kinase
MLNNSVTVLAHGKVNWTLDVLGKRNDGYHDVASIVQQIELADRVSVSKGDDGIRLSVTGPLAEGVPADETNIVWHAVKALGIENVDIVLEKHIPHQAGLGGGSSDAAATLIACNRLFDRNIDRRELMEIGASLGADVPLFLGEATARVEGFGEIVTPLTTGRDTKIVVIKPEIGVSTREAYNALDRIPGRVSRHATASWPNGGPSNDFEDVVYTLYPAILEARSALIAAGATGALLCGSGAAVMGWGDQPENIAARLFADGYKQIWLTRTIL